MQLLNSKEYIAKKEYHDDGWEEINEWIKNGCHGINEIDKFAVELEVHKFNLPNRILPGDKYIRQFVVDGGNKWEFKTKSIFYNLMCKYDLFSEY